ncbi:hypothetical protein HY948_01880 [Candidatus Gottesmanbacteria bacterium]|nr:hypothetical protein [Candidatus Gottesmanbacteria bacterium]
MSAQSRPVITFLLLVFVLSVAVSLFARQTSPQLSKATGSIAGMKLTPTPAATETSEVHAPDGSATLILRAVKNTDGTTTYVFTASGLTGTKFLPMGTSRKIFIKTVGPLASMMIPANTWSPENRYVFLEEKDGTGAKRYYVIQTNGEPFAAEKEYLEVTEPFAAKKTGFMFREATGWASPTLLIITTDKDAQTRGPSYWFEIPSGAFLQLAR